MSASTRSDAHEERLAGMAVARQRAVDAYGRQLQEGRERQEELARHAGFLESVLDGIAQKALHAQTHGSMGTALIRIHNAAQTALQRPLEGTRVRCLMPHRGEQGTVVGWDRDLGVALVTWDDLSGLPPEGVEPGEMEVIA